MTAWRLLLAFLFCLSCWSVVVASAMGEGVVVAICIGSAVVSVALFLWDMRPLLD